MVDKSAYVPVDAIAGHKATDLDVDMDAELFGGGSNTKAPEPAKPITPTPPPSLTSVPPPKFKYKKASSFVKTYAGQKNKRQ